MLEQFIGIEQVDVAEAKALYKEAFNDSDAFTDLYFNAYSKNNKYFFWKMNHQIVCMACVNKKRIFVNGQKKTAGFIVAVATKKEYRNQGLMKSIFQKWLDDISMEFSEIFIQAYNWNVYKSYDFLICTLKKEYTLKKDQFLKPSLFYQKIDYDQILKIQKEFICKNQIKNYSYKTKKENKLYYKMFMAANDKIYMNKFVYLVVSNNDTVVDFAYTDLKEFIKLISNFKEQELKIKSYLDLDKRFFVQINKDIVDTKIYKKKNFDIFFNEAF